MRSLGPAILLLSAATLFGQDEKQLVQKAAPEESVSLAKQDLDSFKKQSAVGDTGKMQLLQAPEIASVGLPGPVTPDPTQKDPSKKSDNWLVDGVMGTNSAGKDGELRALRGPQDPKTKAEDRAEILRQVMAGSRSQTGENEDKPTPAEDLRDPKAAAADLKVGEAKAPNPLDGFMAAWMSPKDVEILKPAMDSKPTSPGAEPDSGPDLSAMIDAHADNLGSAAVSDKPADNPFIDLLDSAPEASLLPEPVLKPTAAPAPQADPAPTLLSDSKDVIPDYAKPLIDDPALKGMKRF